MITEITEKNATDFRITISPLQKYWLATITDKAGKFLKEFIDPDKNFAEWKANIWVNGAPY